MFNTLNAAISLGIKMASIVGDDPTTEEEFLERFRILDDNNEWVTDSSKWGITWSQVQAELARLESEYASLEYARSRSAEYPPITDYLDGVVKGDQAQIDKYIADCQAVKAKYPKGN